MRVICCLTLIGGLLMTAGCGSSRDATETPLPSLVDAEKYRLTEEPRGAVSVIAARETARNGAPLVLVGRIGGSANPWIDGRAAFTVLDASVSVVDDGEESGDEELCLGDCCASQRLACMALVKIVDNDGRLVPVDSRKLLGLNDSDVVVVQGTAQKDDNGNFVMLASGVYVRR